MIDFSKYDIKKVKLEDMFFFLQGEEMNKLEWGWKSPLHFLGLISLPKKYKIKGD